MTAPVFPEFKLLDLEDRAVVHEFLNRHPFEACEYSFGNNFIWRQFDHPRWTVLHGNLCLIFNPPGEPPYALAPIGATDIPKTIEALLDVVPRLVRVPASVAQAYADGLLCAPDRDAFDYVYATEDLADLQGKKYDGKRNRIRKLEREHRWRYIPVDEGHLDDCRKLFEEWFAEKDESAPMASAQKSAIHEALTHFRALGLSGGAIEVDDRLAALSIGEPLTRDTAVIHIEIVSPCCEGLAQIMNREFVRNAFRDFAFINREEDLGIPGLRRAKMSYHPDHLVEKFRLERRV
ncbi:MAG: DUF2156 domain-containing protein [Candidatus Aminicenantales bacterium]